MTKKIVSLAVLLFITVSGFGKVTLPSIFADNMVLQQNSEVAIWGWGDPNEKISITGSWNPNDTVKVTVRNDAGWQARIKTATAGGPYTLEISGSSKHIINNVMLGEVWICSGQSNMEMSVNWGIMNGEEEAAKASHEKLRFFHIMKTGASTPQNDCKATWEVSTPESMRATSAVGYFFGRELMQKLNVPVGLIVAAWGGTPAEVWAPAASIEASPEIYNNRIVKEYNWWPSKPGTTWNSMIHPIVPYKIAGAIWYQGEANVAQPDTYAALMKTLIGSWRKAFEFELPFYYVQIAPYTYGAQDYAFKLREQQSKMQTIPQTGMVVIGDLVDNVKDIHPKNKLDVGKRLAMMALHKTYKMKVDSYQSPELEAMEVGRSSITVAFGNCADGLESKAKWAGNFLIAGSDRVFHPAKAVINGNKVTLSSKQVKTPVAVRYCYDNASMPDLFAKSGLPVAPFRTDNWE